MISIIISSANAEMLKVAILNIQATIGATPFEILSYDNSKGENGICEIYNIGAIAAKYEILCFMHEDLDILTNNWGLKVLETFNANKSIGIIGVAGSAYKSRAPSGWGTASEYPNTIFSNYLQSFKRVKKPSILYNFNPNYEIYSPVVCIDGMWFCTLKNIVIEYPFDEALFKGFHCYDIDYCLSVSRKYIVVVTFSILMEHFSEGGYNRDWFADTLKLHEKWRYSLPRSVLPLSKSEQNLLEKRAFKNIISQMVNLNYSVIEIAGFLYDFYKKNIIKTALYLKLLYYGWKFSRRA